MPPIPGLMCSPVARRGGPSGPSISALGVPRITVAGVEGYTANEGVESAILVEFDEAAVDAADSEDSVDRTVVSTGLETEVDGSWTAMTLAAGVYSVAIAGTGDKLKAADATTYRIRRTATIDGGDPVTSVGAGVSFAVTLITATFTVDDETPDEGDDPVYTAAVSLSATITGLLVYRGAGLIATKAEAPWTYTHEDVAPGTHVPLRAVVTTTQSGAREIEAFSAALTVAAEAPTQVEPEDEDTIAIDAETIPLEAAGTVDGFDANTTGMTWEARLNGSPWVQIGSKGSAPWTATGDLTPLGTLEDEDVLDVKTIREHVLAQGGTATIESPVATLTVVGSFTLDGVAIEGGAVTLQSTEVSPSAFDVHVNGANTATVSASPWLYTSAALPPGTTTLQAVRAGSPVSPLYVVVASALVPTTEEPDGDEIVAANSTFQFQATTPGNTTGVTFSVTGPGGYSQTFAGVDAGGGTSWTYDWNTTGLAQGTYVVTTIRHTAAPNVSAAPRNIVVGTPNPLQIFGSRLHTWLAPQDWALVGGEIDQWNDSSGNGNHFSAASAGERPTVATSWKNGLSAATMSLTRRLRCLAYHATLSQPCTKVMVLDFTTVSVAVLWTGLDATNRIQLTTIGTPRWRLLATTGNNGTAVPAGTTPYWIRATLELDAGAGTDRLFLNGSGTPDIAADCGDASEAGGYLGALYDGTSGMRGRTGEAFAVTGALSGAEVTAIANYIADRWGSF